MLSRGGRAGADGSDRTSAWTDAAPVIVGPSEKGILVNRKDVKLAASRLGELADDALGS